MKRAQDPPIGVGVRCTTNTETNIPWEASVWNLLADAFAAALRKIAFWALTRG